jgi:hypothetical protein
LGDGTKNKKQKREKNKIKTFWCWCWTGELWKETFYNNLDTIRFDTLLSETL